MLKVGLIGAGWMGQGHLKTLVEMADIQVVGVCDTNAEMAAKAAGKHGLAPFTNVVEMLDQAAPDAVVIVTPPQARLELVREAAARGIHCFIEKPPARDLASARQVEAVLASADIIHSVGFMMRYSQAVDRCRELIAGRRVALVRSAMLDGLAIRPNWPRWFFDKSRSGGPLLDQAIHLFDLSRYLLGEPVAVAGFHGNPVVPKAADFTVEESATLIWQYGSGVMQNHTHSWTFPTYTCQIELISDELHLTLDLARSALTGHVAGEQVHYEYPDDRFYRMELDVFFQAVRARRQDLIRSTYADSMGSLALALAAVRSVEAGALVPVEPFAPVR